MPYFKLSGRLGQHFYSIIMETVQLEAKTRDLKVSARSLRANKIIPAVYYGKKEEPVSLQLDYQVFRKAFLKSGSSQVIDLSIDGSKKKHVLVQDVQYHPVTGSIYHVDFLHVNLKEEVTTEVPIVTVGVSPAVKDLGGILSTVKHEITVRCLPMNIPHSVEVDISGLVDFSTSVYIKDLKIPKEVVVLDDPEEVVVIISAPRTEEETISASALEGTAAEAAAEQDAAQLADSADDKKKE